MKNYFVFSFAAVLMAFSACSDLGTNSNGNSVTSCKTEGSDSCEYGSLTDERDGQVYKIVKIGSQVWMAENLNYATDSGSYCYEDSLKYCDKYGRLYKIDAAKEACPAGYHLPSLNEYITLLKAVGGSETRYGKTAPRDPGYPAYSEEASQALRSTVEWPDSGYSATGMRELKGLDAYGFSVLPSGFREKWEDVISCEDAELPEEYHTEEFYGVMGCPSRIFKYMELYGHKYHARYYGAGAEARFWTSEEYVQTDVENESLLNWNTVSFLVGYVPYGSKEVDEYMALSVRCVKDK